VVLIDVFRDGGIGEGIRIGIGSRKENHRQPKQAGDRHDDKSDASRLAAAHARYRRRWRLAARTDDLLV
jgi:hypothetical protein